MLVPKTAPEFSVVSGADVHSVLQSRENELIGLIESTYRLHGAGDTINPPSYFLRFPERPESRIIALPASIGGDDGVDGLKWISSFPANIDSGLPRAAATLTLNDPATGYPFACMEASIISAVRTAASAALAADWLSRNRRRPTRVGFVGTGLIARYIHTFLAAAGWEFERVGVHDLSAEHADAFREHLEESSHGDSVTVHDSAEQLVRSSDLVIFATVAGVPHVHDPDWFSHAPLVLNVSLRDLAADVVLNAVNVVDDVDHCLKANTSVHLAEQRVGHRDFLAGTLCDVMTGKVLPSDDAPLVFSPFGLGVLDLAVGRYVHEELRRSGRLSYVTDFFYDLDRYGKR